MEAANIKRHMAVRAEIPLSAPSCFYDRLAADRVRAGNPDTPEYEVCVRETVDELLAGETTSSHPGMLLGKIQSGKTRAFLGIFGLLWKTVTPRAIAFGDWRSAMRFAASITCLSAERENNGAQKTFQAASSPLSPRVSNAEAWSAGSGRWAALVPMRTRAATRLGAAAAISRAQDPPTEQPTTTIRLPFANFRAAAAHASMLWPNE